MRADREQIENETGDRPALRDRVLRTERPKVCDHTIPPSPEPCPVFCATKRPAS